MRRLRLHVVLAAAVVAVAGWLAARRIAPPSPSPGPAASLAPAGAVPAASPAVAAKRAPQGRAPLAQPSVGVPDVAARTEAAALLKDAAVARAHGDLRATVELLRAAVEHAPAVETHAALGGLYLELGAASAAEPHLRAAAEADPHSADRWVTLANALALKPDPMAAAAALGRARAAEPSLRGARDAEGWLRRDPTPAMP